MYFYLNFNLNNFRKSPIVTTQVNPTQTTKSNAPQVPSVQASTSTIGTGSGQPIFLFQTPQIFSPQVVPTPLISTDQPQPLSTKLTIIPVPEPITKTPVKPKFKPKPKAGNLKLAQPTTNSSDEPSRVSSAATPTTAASDTTNPSVTLPTSTVPNIFTTVYPINTLAQHLPVLKSVSTRYV